MTHPAPPDTPACPTAALQLLGPPLLSVGQGKPTPLQPKDAVLLAAVALEGPQPRDRWAAFFWPHTDTEGALNNLRQRLFQLNKAAGRPVLPHLHSLQLAPGVQHDLAPLQQGPEQPLRDACLTLDLLPGCNLVDAPLAQAWLQQARGRWLQRRGDVLRNKVHTHLQTGNGAEALAWAQRWALVDPWSEEAHAHVMRLLGARGNRAQALLCFRTFEHALRTGPGLRPSDALQNLARQLQQARPAEPGADAGQSEGDGDGHSDWQEDANDTTASSNLARDASTSRFQARLLSQRLAHPPDLIGRDTELAQLRAAHQQHRLCVVQGEPGAGKSRLASHWAASQARVAVAPALWGDHHQPYAWLSRLLPALFPAGDAGPEIGTSVSAPLDPTARREFAHLDLRFGPPSTPSLNPLRLAQAVQAALASYDLVWVDDLQFADAASLALLMQLARPGVGPRWLFGLRPHEAPPELQQWLDAQAGGLVRVQLAPWRTADVQALLASVGWPPQQGAHWASAALQATGGNPLFVLRTLQAAAEDGLQPGQATRLPGTVLELMQSRLDQLPPEALSLARVAAFAGADFSLAVAAAVLQRHPVDLAVPWQQLQNAQLLHNEQLAHEVAAAALRQATPQPIAQWLHAALAQALQRAGVPPARVAPHWLQAGQHAPAAALFRAAAAQACRQGLRAEEAQLLGQAAACFQQAGLHSERFAVLVDRLGALVQCDAAQHPVAAEELLQLTKLLNVSSALNPTPPGLTASPSPTIAENIAQRQQAVALAAAAESYNARGQFGWVQEHLPQALVLARAQGDIEVEAIAARRLAIAWAHSGQPAQALATLEDASRRLEAHLPAASQAELLSELGTVLAYAGRRAEAADVQQRGIAAATAAGLLSDAQTGRANRAINLYFMGQLALAEQVMQDMLNRQEHVPDQPGLALGAELSHGQMLRDIGRHGAALARMQKVLDAGRQTGQAMWALHAENNLAQLWLVLAQPARARQLLQPREDCAALPPFMLATRALLQAQTAAALKQDPKPLLLQAQATLQRGDRDDVRFRLMAEQGLWLPSQDAFDLAQKLFRQAQQVQMQGMAALALVRQVQALQGLGNKHQAGTAALHAAAAVQHSQPMAAYLPGLWAVLAAAMADAGLDQAAISVLLCAKAWLQASAAATPPALLPALLERNPANGQLRLLAARLGMKV